MFTHDNATTVAGRARLPARPPSAYSDSSHWQSQESLSDGSSRGHSLTVTPAVTVLDTCGMLSPSQGTGTVTEPASLRLARPLRLARSRHGVSLLVRARGPSQSQVTVGLAGGWPAAGLGLTRIQVSGSQTVLSSALPHRAAVSGGRRLWDPFNASLSAGPRCHVTGTVLQLAALACQ